MVTLKDVAKAAGVSCSTVSAVLGNRAEKLGIKPETRKLVQRTAARMRYRRNAIAAQMKSGQANTLAMILPEGGTPEFVMRAATAATVEAEKHGCFMKIIAANGKEDFITRLDSVLSQCPAALLHWGKAGERGDYLMSAARECGVPVVFLDFSETIGSGSVRTDDRAGIAQAVEHLCALGHRRIAHVTTFKGERFGDERAEAFLSEMAKRGLPVKTEWIYRDECFRSGGPLVPFLERLFSEPERPTAVSCGNDLIALRVMTALERQGLRIPEEVSVIGYSDRSFGGACEPELTTIHQPFDRMGETAVKLALEGGAREVLIPTELVVRGSTASPN